MCDTDFVPASVWDERAFVACKVICEWLWDCVTAEYQPAETT